MIDLHLWRATHGVPIEDMRRDRARGNKLCHRLGAQRTPDSDGDLHRLDVRVLTRKQMNLSPAPTDIISVVEMFARHPAALWRHDRSTSLRHGAEEK
jgi:hypothetical protein